MRIVLHHHVNASHHTIECACSVALLVAGVPAATAVALATLPAPAAAKRPAVVSRAPLPALASTPGASEVLELLSAPLVAVVAAAAALPLSPICSIVVLHSTQLAGALATLVSELDGKCLCDPGGKSVSLSSAPGMGGAPRRGGP